MDNPWKHISLQDYEEHMKLGSILQLQALNEIMRAQFAAYDTHSAMVLGIAGGNGLEHIDEKKYDTIYGVDINKAYLEKCKERYPKLKDTFIPLLADVAEGGELPHVDLVVADLFLEYVGYTAFQNAIKQIDPSYVSCVIQINTENDFVSESPYLHSFDCIEQVHNQMEEEELNKAMNGIGWRFIKKEEVLLPNGKKLMRLDYRRKCKVSFYDEVNEDKVRFAVIIATYHNQLILCKQKERDTYEVPGGHREAGEPIEETAKRELYEETGATEFSLKQIGMYSVLGNDGVYENKEESFGVLYYAEVTKLEALPAEFEMEKIELMTESPENWTYPDIQPILMKKWREKCFS